MNSIKPKLALFSLIGIVVISTLSAVQSYGAGYDYTPTIVQVSNLNQPDSVGFNLVENLNALFYKKIQEESIYLWDSPAKKIKIGKVALKMMEDKNDVHFSDNDEIFLYEFWKLYNKEFEFQIVGFSFFRRKPDGSKFNLGYIEAADVKPMLSSLVIPTNANGQANLTYWSALMSKKYNFNLVKFGNKDFSTNPGASFNLKDQAFANPKVKSNVYKIENVKEVEYVIVPGIDKSAQGRWIFTAMENYFLDNRHEYFNNIDEPAISYLDPNAALKVTRIEVVEIWKRNGIQDISFQPIRIKIFVNDKPMREMSMTELEHFALLIQFKPIEEYLREKDFKFTIRRVNYEQIYGYKSDSFWRALLIQNWNQITYYTSN